MSVSKKQNRANRENAQKSTGPTTNEGKQTSSRNAVKHGLYSEQIVIRTANLIESEDEYNDLIESLYDELKPKTAMQECLVKKIAACLWRSRRAIAAETAHITRQIEKVGSDGPSRYMLEQIYGRERDLDTDPVSTDAFENIFRNLITIRSIPHFAGSYDVSKYEMRLDRAMMRAYTLLRMLQNPIKSKNKENKKDNNHLIDPESGHESEPQPKPNPEQKPETELISEPESQPKAESEQQPKPKRKPEPKSKPKSQSKTKSSRKNNHNHPANENDNGDNYHNHDNNQNTATENPAHKSNTNTTAKTKSSSKTPLPPMTANEIPTPPPDNKGSNVVSGLCTRHPAVAVATADKNGMTKSPSPPPGTAGIPTLCTVVSGPDFDSGRNCDLTLNVYKKWGNEPISP